MNSDLVFTHFWSGFSFFFIHSKSWSLFRSVIFDAISHNGKSICEGRAKLDEKFNFDPPKQIAFSDYQITKKSNMKSKLRLNATNLSTWFQPRLLQILCYVQAKFILHNIYIILLTQLYLNQTILHELFYLQIYYASQLPFLLLFFD